VSADPLPGQELKFQQLPLNGGLGPSAGGALYPGRDLLSTATPNETGNYVGQYMADDFADNYDTPVVHVKWWGSYLSDEFDGVQRFLISFESDVPATQTEPSHPGGELLTQVVNRGALSPASGTFTESAIATDPGASEQLYEYNAELALPFGQEAGVVYWLKIVALVNPFDDGPIEWGWHDRDYGLEDTKASGVPVPGETNLLPGPGGPVWHFQDDAVGGFVNIELLEEPLATVFQPDYAPFNYQSPADGPAFIDDFSMDLAFELYTIPEPSTLVLLLVGSAATAAINRRRRIAHKRDTARFRS
jgi:hypothetical protein